MNEIDLRERLFDLANDAPAGFIPPSDRLRRAQRRVALTIASGVVIVLALVGVGVAGASAWQDRGLTPIRESPRPTPTQGARETATEIEMPTAAPPNLHVYASDVFTSVRGWIAFRSGSDIVAVDPTDADSTIVLGPASGSDPIAWSSDGTELLLRREIAPLSGHAATWGSLSPDGSEIVYSIDGWRRGPFIVDADGGKPRSLGDTCPDQEIEGELREVCGEPAAEAAAWSPDGSTIAWLDFGEGTIPGVGHKNFLSFVNPDGTGLREGVARLPGTFGGYSLVWSPDGSRLALWMGDRNAQIYVISADGTGLRQITHDGDNRWPTWSPDGSRIAFVRDGALYTMAPDGSDMREVKGVRPEGPIAWNPVPIESGG